MAVQPDLRQQVEAEIMGRGEVTPRNMMGTTADLGEAARKAVEAAAGERK